MAKPQFNMEVSFAFNMEVSFAFNEETHVGIANRIVAIIGKMWYGSNRVIGFKFSTETQRAEAIEKMAQIDEIRHHKVAAYRVGEFGLVIPQRGDSWQCDCGSNAFGLRRDGSVICHGCNRTQQKIECREVVNGGNK